LDIKGPEEKPSRDTVIFETDLHGDLLVFLYTLLKNGMTEFDRNNKTRIIFYNSSEHKEYTLEKLENYRKDSSAVDVKNKNRILYAQILPDVIPTKIYGQYINCGDFVDRGEQTEQVAYMIPFLSRRYRKNFPVNHFQN
jgi:hypothetical protein